MSVAERIPSLLRQQTKGHKIVGLTANDAPGCLDKLMAQFPDLQRWLSDKSVSYGLRFIFPSVGSNLPQVNHQRMVMNS